MGVLPVGEDKLHTERGYVLAKTPRNHIRNHCRRKVSL